MARHRKHKVYALYKGDTFLTIGTMEELAKYTGKPIATLSSIKSHYKNGNRKGTGLVIIEIEEEEKEEYERA